MYIFPLLFQKLWTETRGREKNEERMKSGHDKRINLSIVPLFNELKALVTLTQG